MKKRYTILGTFIMCFFSSFILDSTSEYKQLKENEKDTSDKKEVAPINPVSVIEKHDREKTIQAINMIRNKSVYYLNDYMNDIQAFLFYKYEIDVQKHRTVIYITVQDGTIEDIKGIEKSLINIFHDNKDEYMSNNPIELIGKKKDNDIIYKSTFN